MIMVLCFPPANNTTKPTYQNGLPGWDLVLNSFMHSLSLEELYLIEKVHFSNKGKIEPLKLEELTKHKGEELTKHWNKDLEEKLRIDRALKCKHPSYQG